MARVAVTGACCGIVVLTLVGAGELDRSDPAGVTFAAARVTPLLADLPAPRPTPPAAAPTSAPPAPVVAAAPRATPPPVAPAPVAPAAAADATDPWAPDPSVAPASTTAPSTTVQATEPIEPPANAYAAEAAVVIGTIEIPALGLAVPLNQGLSLHSIDRGPSHWPGSALPGQPGNVVIAGHRVTHTRPFRDIHTLRPGDEVVFTVDGVRSVYVVNGDEIVTPETMRIVDPTPTPVVTLFACHPPGSARYRYVVTADLVATGPLPQG